MSETIKLNKMGTEHIPRVMMKMGIPMILSMVLQACYNIVDSMFVARIPDGNGIIGAGEYAVNALTLAFPVQMLIVAFGIGTGVGVNALLSRTLGANDREKAAKIAGNGIFLGIIIYVAFVLLGFLGITAYLNAQTEDSVIFSMAKSYLTICIFLGFGMVMFSIYEKLLQSTGKTLYSTIAQVAGAAVNIILDPIFIFGYFGLPSMGVDGAAYATVIGQVVSMLTAMFFHYKINTEIKNGLQYIKPDVSIIKQIYVIGLPAIIMQALMSFMTYGINIIFGRVSTEAVTAYGIFYKIQQFIFFAGFGLRDAITPIVSYNFGMGDKKRVKSGIKYGLIFISVIMLVGTAALEIFAEPLVAAFNLSEVTSKLCLAAIHIISVGFIIAGANIAVQGIFQALGCGISSLVISLLRLLIIVLPLAWLFTLSENADTLVWFSFPIAEVCAFVAAVLLMVRANKKLLSEPNAV